LENWLKTQKISWRYVERVKLGEIDIDDAAKKNIRLTEKLDEDYVYSYAQNAEAGVDMFAVVLALVEGRYIVLDGVHRISGYGLALKTETDAYIFDVTDERVISRLRRVINTITNGKGYSPAERLEHACQLVNEGDTTAAAARTMNIRPERITNRVRAESILRDIALAGGDMSSVQKLPLDTIRAIGKISRATDKARVAALVVAAGLNSKDAKRFIDDFVGAFASSAQEADEILRKWDSRLAEQTAELALKKGVGKRGRTSPKWMVLTRKMRECDVIAKQIGGNISKAAARDLAREVQPHINRITTFLHVIKAVINRK
jgi:hypothetical protein